MPRPKSLVFLELETLRYAQGDIFEMGSEETKELKIFLGLRKSLHPFVISVFYGAEERKASWIFSRRSGKKCSGSLMGVKVAPLSI